MPGDASTPALLVATVLAIAACQPSGTPTDQDAKPEAKPEPKPKVEAPAQPPAPDDGASTPPSAPTPVAPPAWFSSAAFEHAAVVREDHSGTKLPSGQTSAMIVLELPAGTTAEQCMEQARAKLDAEVSVLPETATTPQGYLQLQGEAGAYEYAIVCGVAKDKPTMFMSYIQ